MSEIMDRKTIKALSTDTRLEITKLLSKRPYTASELSRILNKHVTTVKEHLDLLEKSNLIKREKTDNKWIYYTLSDKGSKIFKPMHYTWTIVIVFFLFIIIFIQQIMLMNPAATTENKLGAGISTSSEAPELNLSVEGNNIIIKNVDSVSKEEFNVLVDNLPVLFSLKYVNQTEGKTIINVPNLSKNIGKTLVIRYRKIVERSAKIK